jgi:ferrous iron transport protein B
MVSGVKEITIALAGNPNSGKTSIFNALTGAHQKVANFPGVTVEKRFGQKKYGDYDIQIVDLPGTYSLTAYTPDEKIARDFIIDEHPDLIINVIDSGNLERGLYLTMQIIEMGIDVVIDLNMWDEAQSAGIEIDIDKLSLLLGAPVVKTIGNRGQGIDALLSAAISLKENREKIHRHPPVSYGFKLDDVVADLSKQVSLCGGCKACQNPRWLAIKLLEGDPIIKKQCFEESRPTASLKSRLDSSIGHLKKTTNQDPETAITEGRYGYVAGIVREVAKQLPSDRMRLSVRIDNLLTHRVWGYPIFLVMMWLIFQSTFKLGSYPMDWIEAGVALVQQWAILYLPTGVIADLIVDGIIGGVGSVIVFLPNIVILFLGISILEDSGYMARAAFLMDRLMHFLGLHGKSFIPLLMGFGCSVPAIMATRTLESQRDRIVTILLIPLMSCSARLPVYVLFAGAFFADHAANIIFSIYLLGVVASIITARLMRRTILRPDDAPFVMELPPYRWPTILSIMIHMWERTKIYLRKMGGVILLASIILWFLGYFPIKSDFSQNYDSQIEQLIKSPTETSDIQIAKLKGMKASEELEYSFIGRLGNVIHPLVTPLGFNWEMGVSILTGFVAKEVVVSTIGVLYHLGEEAQNLQTILSNPETALTPLSAFAFMVFILLYTPCMPTIFAVKREIGVKWMWFSVIFQALMAWISALIIFQGGKLLGF